MNKAEHMVINKQLSYVIRRKNATINAPDNNPLRQEHTCPTVGHLKRLGRLRRDREQICSVCSAVLEAFGAAWTLSALIQHAKSEVVGCRLSEPLDSLIGGVLVNQRGV